jgi:hypothetical protein
VRRLFVAVVACSVVAVGATAPVAQAKGRLVAKLFATTHSPKADKKWPIKITAKNSASGKGVCGSVRYAFLFNGKVVGRRSPGVGSKFCGNFSDPAIIFPKRAAGIGLTFRAVVDSKIGQANLDYAIKVSS